MHASYSDDLEILEESLHYRFRNRAFLLEAITHRSYCHEFPDQLNTYNERIEFLGDAVLGLVITESLFREESHYEESQMSKFKSYLVSRKILARLATEIDLGKHLRIGKGEEMSGGRKKLSLLANTLEAIFGALYLDSDYETARAAILRLYTSVFREVVTEGIHDDFKTELQEISQMVFGNLPDYRLTGESGDDHNKTFTYEVYLGGKKYGVGTGKNKKAAQTHAARQALETLKKE